MWTLIRIGLTNVRRDRVVQALTFVLPIVFFSIFASVFGMSFGGWVSGVIFDATGSYAAAFANGFAWNGLNILIVVGLLIHARARGRLAMA